MPLLSSSLSRPFYPLKSITGGKGIKATSFINLLKSKQTFLLQVLLTMFLQLFISFFAIYKTKNEDALLKFVKQYFILICILQIAVIILLAFVPMPILPKFILFTMFSIMNGFIIPLYVPNLSSKDIVDSGIQASVIFSTMITIGCIIIYSGVDTTFFNVFLVVASIILIIWSLYISLFQSNDVQQKKTTFTIYRNISTILFSLYIIYDTYTILSFDYDGDFVTAAFDYYMDIFTVFKNLLMNTED